MRTQDCKLGSFYWIKTYYKNQYDETVISGWKLAEKVDSKGYCWRVGYCCCECGCAPQYHEKSVYIIGDEVKKPA